MDTSYYDNLKLIYPEIAIAVDRIDRENPGNVRFYIPVLTPNMSTNTAKESTIYLNNKNIQNSNKSAVDISNIKITNYIYIPLPKYLCTYYTSTGMNGEYSITSSENSAYNVTLESVNTDDEDSGYIAAGSTWIVVFIGGDINKPQIIGQYIEYNEKNNAQN